MISIALSFVSYFISALLHIAVFRKYGLNNKEYKSYWAVPLLLFLINIFIQIQWGDLPLSGLTLFFLLWGTHYIFFTSPLLSDEGPSAKILFFVKDKGRTNLLEITGQFKNEELAVKRINDLKRSSLIDKKGDKLKATEKGVFVIRLFRLYREILGK